MTGFSYFVAVTCPDKFCWISTVPCFLWLVEQVICISGRVYKYGCRLSVNYQLLNCTHTYLILPICKRHMKELLTAKVKRFYLWSSLLMHSDMWPSGVTQSVRTKLCFVGFVLVYYCTGARWPGQAGHTHIVAVETPRPEQSRHTHLRSYRVNVNNVCVCIYMCYTYVVTEETRIMCVNVYYNAVLVPGDPLRSDHAVPNKWCPLYNIRASVRPNSVFWRFLPSGGRPWISNIKPSNVTCHLVAVRGTRTW